MKGLEFEYNKEVSERLSAKFALSVSSGEDAKGASMAEVDPKELIFGLD